MRTRNLKDRILRLNAALLAGLLFLMPPAGELVFAAQPDQIADKTAAEDALEAEKEAFVQDYPAQPDFVIGSAKDWEIFAENAHSDQWSRNRTVRLTDDIRLSGETPRIVFFSGTFDGGGHTIDGVSIRAEVSETGLFEQLVEGAVIKDLKVSGAVHPVGRQTVIGGLVGVNRGTIRDCTWFGSAEAHQSVGGIAGRNESGGLIEDCRSGGILQADTQAGGIAGYNAGLIRGCTSETQVDTVYTDVPFSTDDLSLTLNEILQTGRVTTVDNMDQKADIGGIAGYNIGTVLSCTNTGRVGYEHVGYGIGGIAGRTTGLVKNCVNEGEIYGRREVGGIVGQQQPDLTISYAEGKLDEINGELDVLQKMIDSTLADTDAFSNEATGMLSEISRLTGVAKNDVQTITNEAANRADAEATRANDTNGKVKASAGDLKDASDELGKAGDQLMDYAGSMTSAKVSDTSAMGSSVDQISDAFGAVIGAVQGMQATRRTNNTNNGGTDPTETFDSHLAELMTILQPVIDGRAGTATGDSAVFNALDKGTGKNAFLSNLTSKDVYKLTAAVTSLNTTISAYTGDSVGVLGRDLDDAGNYSEQVAGEKTAMQAQLVAIRAAQETIRTSAAAMDAAAASSLSGAAADNAGKLGSAKKELGDAFDDVSDAFERMKGLDLTMNGVSTTTRAASGDLYATIDRMLAQADALNARSRSATSDAVGDLRAINSQMGKISDMLSDAVQSELNRSVDPVDYTKDISGEDLENAVSGRTTGSKNRATIHADADGGGIAGLMGINNQLNPERDISVLSDRSTNATMLEKAIVDDCENTGLVDCDGNYAGGITGRMQMGIIYESRNLGMVDADGEYAGGIAGYSGAVIKECLAKSHVRGTSHVGGIAGSGDVLTDNKAMVRILDAVSSAGAIAGAVEDAGEEKLSGNLWCGGSYHAIGDVDYAGRAEEAPYETLLEDNGGLFKSLRLTFLTDDAEVGEVICGYGDSLQGTAIPMVPSKEGFYGTWDRTDFERISEEDRIHAVYTRVVTLISCDYTREGDGRTVFFAEGSFAPGDAITLVEAKTLTDAKGEKNGEEYVLKLPKSADGAEEHTMRFLADPDVRDTEIAQIDGEEVRKPATETMGAYLTFTVRGEEIHLRVSSNTGVLTKAKPYLPVAGGIAAGLAVIAAAVVIVKKRRGRLIPEAGDVEQSTEETLDSDRKKQSKAEAEDSEGEEQSKAEASNSVSEKESRAEETTEKP